MSDDKKTLRHLMVGILIFVGPVLLIGLLLVADKIGYIYGVALGAGSSIILLIHMNYSIGESLKRSPKKAERYAMISYYLRGLITVLVVLAAVLVSKIHIIGTLLGLFSIKISALIYPYLNRDNIKSDE